MTMAEKIPLKVYAFTLRLLFDAQVNITYGDVSLESYDKHDDSDSNVVNCPFSIEIFGI